MRNDLSLDIEMIDREYVPPDLEAMRQEALQQADNLLAVGIFAAPTDDKIVPSRKNSMGLR